MPEITRKLITSETMQVIETYEDSQFLMVRQQNDLSQPELYVLEEMRSAPRLKTIMVITAEQSIPLSSTALSHFLGTFKMRGNPDTFCVFEIDGVDIYEQQ